MKRALTFLLTIVCVSGAMADRPGGVAIIDFDTGNNVSPTVRFGNTPIAVARSTGGWRAYVGLHPQLIPGDYVIRITSEGVDSNETFHVQAPASRKVEITPPECADIKAQIEWRDASLGATYLDVPLPLLTSRLKDQARLTAPGTWLSAPVPNEIRAPAGGLIVRTEPPGAQSIALMIDHGQGVASLLCPVLSPLVALEQRITRGQALGSLASDGKLWWSVVLNGQRVNPLALTYAR